MKFASVLPMPVKAIDCVKTKVRAPLDHCF